MAEARHTLVVAVLLTILNGVWGWRCAYYRNIFDQQPEYIECLWECCGQPSNRHCCVPSTTIVGFTLGSAVVIAAVTLFLCYYCRHRRETRALMKTRYPAASLSVMNQGERS